MPRAPFLLQILIKHLLLAFLSFRHFRKAKSGLGLVFLRVPVARPIIFPVFQIDRRAINLAPCHNLLPRELRPGRRLHREEPVRVHNRGSTSLRPLPFAQLAPEPLNPVRDLIQADSAPSQATLRSGLRSFSPGLRPDEPSRESDVALVDLVGLQVLEIGLDLVVVWLGMEEEVVVVRIVSYR